MADLLERLEKLTGPSRTMDAAIHATIYPDEFEDPEDAAWFRDFKGVNRADLCYLASIPVPAYTASLDAVLALVEAKMPGAEFNLSNIYGIAAAELPLNYTDKTFETGRHKGGNLCAAVLVALFKALSTGAGR